MDILTRKCDIIYLKNPGISWILDDETYFTLSHSTINGNSYSATPEINNYKPKQKYEAKLLVWIGKETL
jgi:hypothetical protein